MSRPVRVIVSIDTEEDGWGPGTPVTLENAHQLPRLHAFFTRLRIRATYFTTYQFATQRWAMAALRDVAASGTAEIGGHLHPWNTPPSNGPQPPHLSMLCNVPPDVQLAMLRQLTDAIEQGAGTRPTSFRAGRFGLGASTIPALQACGYRVDSSVTPFLSWRWADQGPDFTRAPLDVYLLGDGPDVQVHQPMGRIVEVPLSVGFTRFPVSRWRTLHRGLWSRAGRAVRLEGVASLLGATARAIVSPETTSARVMLAISRRLVEGGLSHLQMFFHSSSLMPGLNQFARRQKHVERLYARIEQFMDGIGAFADPVPATVSEAAAASVYGASLE